MLTIRNGRNKKKLKGAFKKEPRRLKRQRILDEINAAAEAQRLAENAKPVSAQAPPPVEKIKSVGA